MSEQRHIVSSASEEAVDAAIAEALGDAYDCTRVWSAWSCGTMVPDDFHCVADDSERVAEIRNAAIAALQPEFEAIKLQCGKFLAALIGAEKAIEKALPYLPSDTEAVFCGEWLGEVREAIAAVEQPDESSAEPAESKTCDGRGVIGGFVGSESGYQDDSCPDCAPVEPEGGAA